MEEHAGVLKVKTMLGIKNEVTSIAKEAQELDMTSLGKLVFGDIHNRQQNFLTQDDLSVQSINSLSLAYENIFHMPFNIIDKYGATITTLDISHNYFSRNLQFLLEFDNLTSLNLDYNNINNQTVFPHMPKLKLLWLNHNTIENLHPFIKNLYKSVPNLKYLSLMGNKAAPSYLNGGNFYEYLQYRLFVISWFPHLIHLDDRAVTLDQQEEAKKLFKRSLFDNFAEPVPKCMKNLQDRITNIFSKSDTQQVSNRINSII